MKELPDCGLDFPEIIVIVGKHVENLFLGGKNRIRSGLTEFSSLIFQKATCSGLVKTIGCLVKK